METFTVLRVDEFFDIDAGAILLECTGSIDQLVLTVEEYSESKELIAMQLETDPEEVDLEGMTLVLNEDGIPVLPDDAA